MLVAVEPDRDGVREYHREGETVYSEVVDYRPWLLIPGSRCGGSEKGHFLHNKPFTALEGGKYNRLIEYDTWKQFRFAVGVGYESGDPLIAYSAPAKQYLMRTGKRMFDGAGFSDVHRLVLDIETTGLDPESSELLMVALLDNRGNEDVYVGKEEYILRSLLNRVRLLDPDVIEGHNAVAFDLPFLMHRCGVHGMAPTLGRDKREARIGRERKMMIGPNERWFAPIYIPGRHVIDTLIQVQKYDSQIMRHESYGLKAVARDLGIEEPDRIELDRSKITELYAADPDMVELYALQDVRETNRLAGIICPVEFMQSRLVPDGYQGICSTGNGEKWNSILIAEYLARGKGIPERQVPESYIGGYVECCETGVLGPIVKADVESLYPSLMLTRNIKPAADTEDVLLPLLATLKDERIKAKRKMEAAEGAERVYWDGYQQSAKILINSCYGFLGGPFHFGDWRAAEQVTTGGRDVVQRVRDDIKAHGGTPVEVDTDGVMFVPPCGVQGPESEAAFVSLVGKVLPAGIVLAHDGRYKAVLSLRMKNYALLGYDGKIKYKGASLKSRRAEKFAQEFLQTAIRLAFDGRLEDAARLYQDTLRRLYLGEFGIEEIERRERITEKTHTSTGKARLSSAAKGLAIGEYVRVYERADGTIGLSEDYAGDADRLNYMKKLRAFFCRLSSLYPEWEEMFPNPGKRNMHSLVGEPEPEKIPVKRSANSAKRPAKPKPAWPFEPEKGVPLSV